MLTDETVAETTVLTEVEDAAVLEAVEEAEGPTTVLPETGAWEPKEKDEAGTAGVEPGAPEAPGVDGTGTTVVLIGAGTAALIEEAG
jgi:hypothetical protein